MDRVKDKVALVSGAGRGMGKASSIMLAKEGAKVAVTDIDEAFAQETAQEIKANGGEAISFKHDVSKEENWKKAIETTLRTFGKLDIVVNNAGLSLPKSVEDVTLEDIKPFLDVNLYGVFWGTKYGILTMKKGKGGSIINICSTFGLVGYAGQPIYGAAKGAVKIFTKCAALHCGEKGYNIRVNNICPGAVRTRLLAECTEEEIDHLVKIHPIGRVGEPIDIAYGVVYLASDESAFVTGAELVIDGGYTAQ